MKPTPSSPLSSITSTVDNKLTRLDHSVTVIIENPDQTASREDGISPTIERLHRFHGTSIILECSRGLKLGPSHATACTIFHRFYHSASLTSHDVWSVSMASTLLATKVEEEPRSLKQIIEEYAKIYARRLILADFPDDDKKDFPTKEEIVRSSPHLAYLPVQISEKFKQHICDTRLPQHLNKFGPVFKEWHAQITKMESILLRQLGFTFYWISDSHPHKFILNFCQALELKDKMVTQRAWNYCNDSYRLDLSVRYPPEVIAASVILLAVRDFNIVLPTKPRPWWEAFIGNKVDKANELVDAANAILGTCTLCLGMENGLPVSEQKDIDSIRSPNEHQDDDNSLYMDWLVASKGFVRSLLNRDEEDNEKSFLDPNSFLWFCQKETFEKVIKPNDV